jgi:hypothetical protein
MPLECLAQKSLGRSQIAPFTRPEFDGVTVAVDDSIEIFPLASHFDVSLIHVPFPADAPFATIKALEQFRRAMDNPSVNSRMIDGDTAHGHHLLEIAKAQAVGEIPPDTEQDH